MNIVIVPNTFHSCGPSEPEPARGWWRVPKHVWAERLGVVNLVLWGALLTLWAVAASVAAARSLVGA